jgi:hypothetical protein
MADAKYRGGMVKVNSRARSAAANPQTIDANHDRCSCFLLCLRTLQDYSHPDARWGEGGSWQLAGGPPKRQFSRDIALAGGYLMASRRWRMYTAPDRAGSSALRSVSQQTMKATRPVQ